MFKLVGNGNELTVTSGGNDAHLCKNNVLNFFCRTKMLDKVKTAFFLNSHVPINTICSKY
jgi:hypothetical protein